MLKKGNVYVDFFNCLVGSDNSFLGLSLSFYFDISKMAMEEINGWSKIRLSLT